MTILRGGSRRRAGLVIHTTRSLRPEDVITNDGIRCTSPSRTLVDLAGVVTATVLARALEQSLVLNMFDGAALESALARGRGRRGTGMLRRLLAGLSAEPPPVRSELERRFLELVRSTDLPRPAVNCVVAGYEVDFHWPVARVIVETDGRARHRTPQAFARDRARDLSLELAGWHVLRVTWRQVVEQPEAVVALLRRRLRAGGAA